MVASASWHVKKAAFEPLFVFEPQKRLKKAFFRCLLGLQANRYVREQLLNK